MECHHADRFRALRPRRLQPGHFPELVEQRKPFERGNQDGPSTDLGHQPKEEGAHARRPPGTRQLPRMEQLEHLGLRIGQQGSNHSGPRPAVLIDEPHEARRPSLRGLWPPLEPTRREPARVRRKRQPAVHMVTEQYATAGEVF
jgi:hypothetical protein